MEEGGGKPGFPGAASSLRQGGRVADFLVRPEEKVLRIGGIGVASVMLAPGELSIEQAGVEGRHLFGVVVVGNAEVFCSEELEYGSGGNGSHIAALVVEPFGVSLFGDAVADEG